METNSRSITKSSVERAHESGTDRLAFGLGELARQLDVSTNFLRLEIARGRLRPARLGRRIVVSTTEAKRYLETAMASALAD